jgi:hypothetical protein
MSRGLMGITGPSVISIAGVFFFPFRGLFWFWPFFLCVPAAVLLLWGQGLMRGRVALAGVIVGIYLLFGCSYYLWSGGAAFGPRHIIPCLPFAAYLALRPSSFLLRWLVPVTTVLSLALVLISVSTLAEFPEPQPDQVHPERLNPLFRIALPRFLHGRMSVKTIGQEGLIEWSDQPLPAGDPHFHDACNLGEVLGLRGLFSLLPLALLDGVLVVYLWQKGRVSGAAAGTVREGP